MGKSRKLRDLKRSLCRAPDFPQGVEQIGHAADVGSGFQDFGLQGRWEHITRTFLGWHRHAGLRYGNDSPETGPHR
jgi:hypothetical protein